MARLSLRRLDLRWLRPPKIAADGTMSLVDHLREMRYRVVVATVEIVVGMVLAFVFRNGLWAVMMHPYNLAVAQVKHSHPSANVVAVLVGATAPMMLTLKVAFVGGLLLSCPFWLYQLWAFIAPGLVAREKRWAFRFLGSAVPLFLAGCAVGYWILPKGIAVMLSFTPTDESVSNMMELSQFLDFALKMILLFGVSFLLPVVLVLLNLVGVVHARQLARFRTMAVFLCFVFGAVATPSTDPFSMCALAIPMAIMYVVAELLCRANDRRRHYVEPATELAKV